MKCAGEENLWRVRRVKPKEDAESHVISERQQKSVGKTWNKSARLVGWIPGMAWKLGKHLASEAAELVVSKKLSLARGTYLAESSLLHWMHR